MGPFRLLRGFVPLAVPHFVVSRERTAGSASASAAAAFWAAGLDLPRATVITYTTIARLALVAKGPFLTIANAAGFSGLHTTIKALRHRVGERKHAPRDRDVKKPHSHASGAALPRLCARDGKANGNAPTPAASKSAKLSDYECRLVEKAAVAADLLDGLCLTRSRH
jgi:hypothetical protein